VKYLHRGVGRVYPLATRPARRDKLQYASLPVSGRDRLPLLREGRRLWQSKYECDLGPPLLGHVAHDGHHSHNEAVGKHSHPIP
jgi:hypothetical protein